MMELFMKSYYDEFKYQSIDSYQFKDYFLDYFKDKDLSAIEWDKWFNQPGMPIYKPKFNDSLAMVIDIHFILIVQVIFIINSYQNRSVPI